MTNLSRMLNDLGTDTFKQVNKPEISTNHGRFFDFFNGKVKVISVGNIISYEQTSKETLSFKFDFDFKCDKHVKIFFDTHPDIKRFLNVDTFINPKDRIGFVEVAISAVFENTLLDVDIDKSQFETILESIFNILSREVFKKSDLKNEKLSINKDKCINNKKENNHKRGIVNLDAISDYMYELIKGLNEHPDKVTWDNLSFDDKEDMVKELQSNLSSFVDLMNYFELKSTDRCSDDTIDVVSNIIKEKLSKLDSNKEPKCISVNNNSNNLDELKSELNKLEINYSLVKYLKDADTKDMISIFDRNNNECMWICRDGNGYEAFDLVKYLDNNTVSSLEKSNKIHFEYLYDLMNIIVKISPKAKDYDEATASEEIVNNNKVKEIDSMKTEEALENTDEVKPNNEKRLKTKKEFRREFLLNHLDELSDEDILNELRRRMFVNK